MNFNYSLINKILRTKIMVYFFATILAIFILAVVTKFHCVDISIPIVYWLDAVEFQALVKSLIGSDAGLNAPFGSSVNFTTSNPTFFYLIIKLLSLFTSDVTKIINIYFILTFVFSSLFFVYTLLYFKFSPWISVALGTLYAFLPYHFERGTEQLLDSSYYFIPLLCLILIWLWSAVPIFFRYDGKKYVFSLKSYKSFFCLILILVLLPTSIYFMFMFAYLAVIAGLSAFIYRKNLCILVSTFIIVMLAGFSVYKAEIFEYTHQLIDDDYRKEVMLVKSPHSISRYGDAETYGLKVVELLLPINGHRIKFLNDIKGKYNSAHPAVNQNRFSTLGFIGSIGFISLIFFILLPSKKYNFAYKLSILTIFSILFATIGGFSSLISTIFNNLSPQSYLAQARAYDRMSVFVGYFSLLMVGILLQNFAKKGRYFVYALTAIILFVGIYDQTSPKYQWNRMYENYEDKKERYLSDKQFIKEIEGHLGKKSLIFQLPFMMHHPIGRYGLEHVTNRMFYSDPLKAYIHSDSLIWTYGSDYKSVQIEWYKDTASLPAPEMLKKLISFGFSGIYIDRYGYTDSAISLETELKKILPKYIESKDRRFLFFDIRNFLIN